MHDKRKQSPAEPVPAPFWFARCLFVFGLIALLNALNLFLIAGVGPEHLSPALLRVSTYLATPIVLVQRAIPLAVGDLLLAIFFVSLAEAAPLLLLWAALAKARGPKPYLPS